MKAMCILEYSGNIKRLMTKLPFLLRGRWRKGEKRRPKFTHFIKFWKEETKKANDPTYGISVISGKQSSKKDSKLKPTSGG